MKQMSCKQLGGACNIIFSAETFEEIGELSKNHAMEMIAQHDQPHVEAMEKMKKIMGSPESFKDWMKEKQNEFDSLN